eukprot:1076359-Pleurochrysis_carterae.AAC.1
MRYPSAPPPYPHSPKPAAQTLCGLSNCGRRRALLYRKESGDDAVAVQMVAERRRHHRRGHVQQQQLARVDEHGGVDDGVGHALGRHGELVLDEHVPVAPWLCVASKEAAESTVLTQCVEERVREEHLALSA